MWNYLTNLPCNYLLSLISVVLGIVTTFVGIIIALVVGSRDIIPFFNEEGKVENIIPGRKEFLLKIIGTCFVLAIAFAVHSIIVYIFSLIIIATLITELGFLENITATIYKSDKYFEHKQVKSSTEQQEGLKEVEFQEKTVDLQKQLEDTKKQIDSTLLLYHFERVYRLIFGSQITILLILNNQTKVPFISLEAIYRNTIWPNSNYPLNQYIGFLETTLLIQNNGDNTYSVTDTGKKFIDYLIQNNISLAKAF